MVLAASGVEHEELLKIAEPLLSDLPSIRCPEEPKSVYVGGDYRCQAELGKTHFALAFEAPGGWHKEKEAVVLTVLQVLNSSRGLSIVIHLAANLFSPIMSEYNQMLIGGGGSFSAGGPGKGMYSRLYFVLLASCYV
ncbi:Mitochondrial-processing peptidase subunit alpha [Camellia lanceoleosa]|uniref:Mitochondrial-processing peptidase subunit alpha n=1 Tax=Camellia lanceoleosa TaxID=1840588 RepID=A0ACC0GFL4_9ERIC|nr:Mitochondrial-processing peptidase subunit alpha [Camellia lanceoleosa]